MVEHDRVMAPGRCPCGLAATGGGLRLQRGTAPFAEITPREREILECVADGSSNKMIARALDITDGTVKLHVKAILRKLGMRSRVEAAVAAVEHGMGKARRGSRASSGA